MQTSRMSSLLTQMHKCASGRKICTKMQHMCICTRGASISMYDLALQRQLQHLWWSCGILIWKKSSELDLWLEKLYQEGEREGGGGRKGEVEETITVKETINWREWDIRGETEKQEERGKETRQGVKGHCSDLHFSYSWNTKVIQLQWYFFVLRLILLACPVVFLVVLLTVLKHLPVQWQRKERLRELWLEGLLKGTSQTEIMFSATIVIKLDILHGSK